MLASSDSDAFPDRPLRRDYDLDRFSSVVFSVDSRPLGGRPDQGTSNPDGRVNAGLAIDYARPFSRPASAEDDGRGHAGHDAVHSVERARGSSRLLARRKPSRLRPAVFDKPNAQV